MSAERQRGIVFELWGTVPAPQGSKNPWGGEANKNTKPWREAVAAEASEVMHQYALPPLVGPVRITAFCFFPRPKSHYRANGELKPNAPTYKDSKPDLDKLQRALGDALTGVAFRDDAQVAAWDVSKVYVKPDLPHPGVIIRITPLG